MALEAFYNLKEKKKLSLYNAISVCLRKKSYDELSVNEIVEEADISRGSFYNYFNNKNDAILSMVEFKIKHHMDLLLTAIKESNYKLFDGVRKYYYDIESVLYDEINLSVMKNVKFYVELCFESVKTDKFRKYIADVAKWLVDNTYEGKKYLSSLKNMISVFEMTIVLVLDTVFAKVNNAVKLAGDNEMFEYKLSIIEKGIV